MRPHGRPPGRASYHGPMSDHAAASARERAIIHVDMDAFYASVEQLDEPAYRGRPVIVGGLGGRGVVAAASYEARRFGVHSAMPMGRARRLCPDAVYLAPRMARYREVSARVFAVFREFTPLVEGISVDEAWLDVTDSRSLFGDVRAIGARLKDEIRERTGLDASIGMAPNKFLAKLASDYDKPDGFWQITAEGAQAFLAPLPVERLWGIGPKAAVRLQEAGIRTVADLRDAPEGTLSALLGRSAGHFSALARGLDEREVTPSRPEKSVSHEKTFEHDLQDLDAMQRELMALTEAVATRLRRRKISGTTVTVKIRTGSWHTHTRSRTLDRPTAGTRALYRAAAELLAAWRASNPKAGVRLLGAGVSGLTSEQQAGLFPGEETGVDTTLDDIRARFGGDAVVRGRLVGGDDGRE